MKSSSQSERITKVETDYGNLSKQVTQLGQEVTKGFDSLYRSIDASNKESASWRERQLQSKQTNWIGLIGVVAVVVFGMSSVFGGILTILWVVINMQTKSEVQPLKDKLTWMDSQYSITSKMSLDAYNQLTTITAQNSASITDRGDIHRDLNENSNEISKLKSENARFGEKLQEVETQFHKTQDETNLQNAYFQRKLNDNQNTFHEMNGTIPAASAGPYYFPTVPTQSIDGIHQ